MPAPAPITQPITSIAQASAAGAYDATNGSGAYARAPVGSTPTVITDANVRESTIPNLNASVKTAIGTPAPTNPTNPDGTTKDTGTSNSDIPDYNALFSKALGVSDQSGDQTSNNELALIKSMQANADASFAGQLSSIGALYDSRIQNLQSSQASTTKGIENALTLGGGSRYAPISSAGVLSAKETADIQQMNSLVAEENNARAGVIKAQTDQDYQLLSKNLDVLNAAQTRKMDLAKTVVQNMKDTNAYKLEVDKFNHQTAQDAELNKQKQEEISQGQYEFRDLKDQFGNTIGTEVYNKSTGKPVSAVNSIGGKDVTGTGALNPVTIDTGGNLDTKAQSDFLSKLPPPIATMVKSLTDYTMNPANISSRGNTRATIMAYAHQYDPTFDESQFANRAAIRKDYTSGQTAKNIISLNTSVNHLSDLAANFKNLPNGDITKFNTIKDWWSANVGKGDVTKVVTDLNAVAGELAKTFKGTGATDQEVGAIEKGISVNSSPAQFKAFIEEATNLLGGRIDALNGSYQTAVGKPFERSFINPDTQTKLSNLKSQGYDINIQGVKSQTGTGVSTALKTVNPTTGKNYTSTEVVDHLSTDPTYKDKITAARAQGISDDDIASYLSQ